MADVADFQDWIREMLRASDRDSEVAIHLDRALLALIRLHGECGRAPLGPRRHLTRDGSRFRCDLPGGRYPHGPVPWV